MTCPLAARCGGCPLIGQDYRAQLAHKHARLRTALGRYLDLARLELPETIGAEPQLGYRTRAKLVVAPGPAIGLYATDGTHEVVDAPACPVLPASLRDAAAQLRALLASPPAETSGMLRPAVRGRQRQPGALCGLDLREAVGPDGHVRILLTLAIAAGREPSRAAIAATTAAIAARIPALATIALSRGDPDGPRVLGAAPRVVWGAAAVPDTLVPGSFVLAAPGAFVQSHRAQAAALYRLVAAVLATQLGGLTGRSVVDAYAGSGTLGIALAQRGAQVTLVESFAPALAHATQAAAQQGLTLHAEVGDAALVLARLATSGARVDAVIVDPPRRGLSPAARAACAALGPSVLAYVACDPDTLARDLADFIRLGFAVLSVASLDLMPQSEEVEAVVLLGRSEPPRPVPVAQHEGLIALDKPPHEPTALEGRGGVSLLDRLRALPGMLGAEVVHRLDVGASGLCLFARSAEEAERWLRALNGPDAEQRYLALCRGVTRPRGAIGGPKGGSRAGSVARSRYERLAVVAGHSLLLVRTGRARPHQLCRDLAAIGHPVLGDARHGHGSSNRHAAERHGLDRPFLHCSRLLLPVLEGAPLELTAPLPGDLLMVLARMGLREAPG